MLDAMQLSLSICLAPIVPTGRGHFSEHSRGYQGVNFSLYYVASVYKTPFFVRSAEQWKFHFYTLNLCDYFSTHSQQEIREARVQLDKKVFTKFFDFESAFRDCWEQRHSCTS